jgi:hypothetical protein
LTDSGDIVTLLHPLIVEVTKTPWKKGGKMRSIPGKLRFHTNIMSITHGSEVQLHAGYPLTMDSKSAWPIQNTDPKAFLVSELQELCGSNRQHLLGAPGESNALRSVHSWECTAPNLQPPCYMEVERYGERWKGPKGDNAQLCILGVVLGRQKSCKIISGGKS